MSETTDRQVITALAGGARIIARDLGGWDGYEYELAQPSVLLSSSQINRLIDNGWIYSSNTAYFLTDEGKKAYLRSTDELGDGRLITKSDVRDSAQGAEPDRRRPEPKQRKGNEVSNERGWDCMGLDTTHDCWHGPYSQFMRWRQWLNRFIMEDRGEAGDKAAMKISHMGATKEAIEKAWADGHYDDQSLPINVLMGHSDCDGDIPAEVCGPLADALEGLLKHMPERGIYDEQRPATERFIRGLRRAAEAGENVGFH